MLRGKGRLGEKLRGLLRRGGPDTNEENARARDPFMFEAQQAFSKGDVATARRLFEHELRLNPENVLAELGLARVDYALGDLNSGTPKLERGFTRALARRLDPLVWRTLDELGRTFSPDHLRPATLLRIAQGLKEAPEGLQERARSFIDVAAAKSRKAPPEFPAIDDPAGGFDPFEGEQFPPPMVDRCRLLTLGNGFLELGRSDGTRQRVAFDKVKAISVAQVKGGGAQGKAMIVTDLVFWWGTHLRGATVARLPSNALSLNQHFPGLRPADAFESLLEQLSDGKRPLVRHTSPTKSSEYIPFESEAAIDDAMYRKRRDPPSMIE
jgi:hypothetical protein